MLEPVHLSRLTPLAFLERTAATFPDRVGVVDGARRFTWAHFRERVRRLAVALQESGIRKGDRVAFLCFNTHELLEAHYGVPGRAPYWSRSTLGLVPEEIGYIVEHSGARLLVVDRSLEHLVPKARRSSICRRRRRRLRGLPRRRARRRARAAAAGRGRHDLNQLHQRHDRPPKGVMYTHRGAYLNALAEVHTLGSTRRSVYLWTLPMFHCNGWCFTWAVTAAGATHVCLRKSSRRSSGGCSTRPASPTMCGAPTVLVMLGADRRCAPARAADHGHDRGRAAPARRDRAHRGARLVDQPRLRADRDVRPDHDLRVEPGVGRPRRSKSGRG